MAHGGAGEGRGHTDPWEGRLTGTQGRLRRGAAATEWREDAFSVNAARAAGSESHTFS